VQAQHERHLAYPCIVPRIVKVESILVCELAVDILEAPPLLAIPFQGRKQLRRIDDVCATCWRRVGDDQCGRFREDLKSISWIHKVSRCKRRPDAHRTYQRCDLLHVLGMIVENNKDGTIR